MIAARTLALALASASVAAVSAAYAIPQAFDPSGRFPRLLLIPSVGEGSQSVAPSFRCGGPQSDRMAASEGFIRGPGTARQSPDAYVGDGSGKPGREPLATPRAFLRIIPSSGFL